LDQNEVILRLSDQLEEPTLATIRGEDIHVLLEESGFLAGARGPGFAGGGGDAGQGAVVGCRSVSVDELLGRPTMRS